LIGHSTQISETGISGGDYNKNIGNLLSLSGESTGVVTNPGDATMDDIRTMFKNAW
jgi:uncharacterized protein YjiK